MIRERMRGWLGQYDADGLFRHTFVVMLFTHVGSVMNMLFHVVMGRALSQVEYGVLASMLGVVLIFGTPLMAVQTTLAHFSARLREEGRPGAVRGLVAQWYRKASWVVVPVAVAGILFSGRLAAFFQLESRAPVLLVSGICAATILLMIIPGVLQGLQSFIWMCMTVNVWGIMRLVLGAALVLTLGRLAVYALAAQAVSVLLAIGVGFWGLHAVLRGAPREEGVFPGAGRYFALSLVGLACFGFLMNADVVMVKHLFDPVRAGVFAQAATIGRTVIFLSQPVVTALFPKVVSAGSASRGHHVTLLRGIGLSVATIGAAALLCVLFPGVPLLVLYDQHDPSPEQVRLVRLVTLAMSPLGLTYLLLSFEMAQHRFRLILPLGACALAYIVGVAIWHAALTQVVAVLAAVSVASAVGLLVCLLGQRMIR
ncbi:MAG: hypothetical protein JXB04_05825 [Kiritimatiellae bacterium]|nr:hypothetical protein [Kiritimatiellia bacterium]